MHTLIQRIDQLLPQTQCGKCGYEGCLPYATAMAQGQAINRCPPGGDKGIAQLAHLLGRPVLPLDPECGQHHALQKAVIDEEHCIGCTLCIKACPVDAIVGANKFMHTVVADLCSGCDLCVPVCPVDCIALEKAHRTWTPQDAQQARQRYEARKTRLAQQAKETQTRREKAQQHWVTKPEVSTLPTTTTVDPKQAAIAQALARARARRQTAQK